METGTVTGWTGVAYLRSDDDLAREPEGAAPFTGDPSDEGMACQADALDDFDDDDFDDEFDDDFEEEWDEELPGDADQFEPDEVEQADDAVEVEPDFDDDE